jgi:hypothetical protein
MQGCGGRTAKSQSQNAVHSMGACSTQECKMLLQGLPAAQTVDQGGVSGIPNSPYACCKQCAAAMHSCMLSSDTFGCIQCYWWLRNDVQHVAVELWCMTKLTSGAWHVACGGACGVLETLKLLLHGH